MSLSRVTLAVLWICSLVPIFDLIAKNGIEHPPHRDLYTVEYRALIAKGADTCSNYLVDPDVSARGKRAWQPGWEKCEAITRLNEDIAAHDLAHDYPENMSVVDKAFEAATHPPRKEAAFPLPFFGAELSPS